MEVAEASGENTSAELDFEASEQDSDEEVTPEETSESEESERASEVEKTEVEDTLEVDEVEEGAEKSQTEVTKEIVEGLEALADKVYKAGRSAELNGSGSIALNSTYRKLARLARTLKRTL